MGGKALVRLGDNIPSPPGILTILWTRPPLRSLLTSRRHRRPAFNAR